MTAFRAGLLVLPALAAALCFAGCGAAAKPAEKKSGERTYPVRTAPVTVRALKYELETTGSLQAQDIYRVDAQVPGIVEDLAFNEGDRVTPEKVLCRISPKTYALNAQRMKAAWQKAKDAYLKALADVADTERKSRNDVERTKIKLAQAERDCQRLQPAYDSGALSEEGMLTARDRRESAAIELKDSQEALKTLVETMRTLAVQKESEAKQAEVEWQQAEDDLRKSSVVSPVAGVIDQRFITNGTQVTPGAGGVPLAQVVGPGLKLKFTLPEQQVAAVREKTRITFAVAAYPAREFGAEIYYISDLADPKTRLVTCWATVDKTDAVLKSGFFCRIQIVTEERDRAVAIALTAALPTERGFVVFVVEDGKARQRPVTLGLQLADKAVEVKEGLKEGERIVIEGANALRDGVPVKEVGAESKTEALPAAPQPLGPPKASGAGEKRQ
jgi:membrane fusion protein, multidrug efflux system